MVSVFDYLAKGSISVVYIFS